MTINTDTVQIPISSTILARQHSLGSWQGRYKVKPTGSSKGFRDSEILVLRVPWNYRREGRVQKRSGPIGGSFFSAEICVSQQPVASSQHTSIQGWGTTLAAYLRSHPPTRGTHPRHICVLGSCTLVNHVHTYAPEGGGGEGRGQSRR